MNILYIAASFPMEGKGATIYTDLAEELHKRGHNITVAVSEQKRNMKKTTLGEERGFKVLRAVVGDYYDVGFIKKGIVQLLLPFIMKKEIKKHLGKESFDMVLFESPPVTNVGVVRWAKKKFQAKAYLMLKDIFPQNGRDIGIIGRGFIGDVLFSFFRKKEKALYNTADLIGCMSPKNKEYILEHNPQIPPEKVEIFPNAKKITDDYKTKSFPVREKMGIPTDSCLFLFGGNMGRPQYIPLLCKGIKTFKDREDIFFVFVGRGTDRHLLSETAEKENSKNTIVLDNLPRDEFEQLTREADVGLIILDPRFTIPNYPSRILSYMEYAKPVLAATDTVTDIKELIEEAECGWWVKSADEEGFFRKINEIAEYSDRCSLGEKGRKYLIDRFTVEKCADILEKHQ